MVERTASGAWGSPVNLAAVNSSEAEWFPTVTRSGTLYFGSERPGGKGGADIWRSRLVGGAYQAPENVSEVNTPAGEFEPMVSPDERFMVFAAIGRAGGLGAFDLWISYNQDGNWSQPAHLEPPINTPGWDFGPRLTPDGRTLLFTSSRAPGRKRDHALSYRQLIAKLRAPGNGLRDIYYLSVAALPTAPQAHPDTTGATPE
jgi:Tol biopolymer transport system component